MEDNINKEEVPNTEEQIPADDFFIDETAETKEPVDEANVSEKDGEKITEPENQDKVNHAFAQKQKELKEARAKLEQAQKEKEELDKKLKAITEKGRPEIPPMPSPYDDDYDQMIAERDKAIADQRAYDVRQEIIANQEKEKHESYIASVKEHAKKVTDGFESKAVEHGLNQQEIRKIHETIAPYVTNQNADLVEYVMTHEDGPLTLKYLAENQADLDKLNSMNLVSAALYVVNDIMPKAIKFKKQLTQTPDPHPVPRNTGAIVKDDPLLEGVTYE